MGINEASMIWIEGLTQKKLVVATPMYAGNCTGFYMQGMMGLASLCTSYGVKFKTIILGDSLVTRGRNRCVDIFKATCSDPDDKLMFIDADIQFNPADVLKLMMLDKDVAGALYPLKKLNWQRVKSIITRQPDFPAEDLPRAACDYVFNIKFPVGSLMKIDVTEPTIVRDLGTGFLMIKRKVFDKIEEAGLAKSYTPCMNEEVYADTKVFDHFPAGIDTELNAGTEGAYLSEDWVFCRRWQKCGGEVYACPWIKLSHFGTMGFEGDMATLAASGSKIGEEWQAT
jgi:hypothetical protein